MKTTFSLEAAGDPLRLGRNAASHALRACSSVTVGARPVPYRHFRHG